MSDDLNGWSRDELVSIARWYLVHGFGLDGQDTTWTIEYDHNSLTCPGRRPVDEQQVAEGRRLLAHAYPSTRITLKRRGLTEHERLGDI